MTTVNRSCEVVRRILNLCARKWRHPNGMSWLETVPLIEIDRNHHARKPYPLSWEEQALLFDELPYDPNGQMALFKVNTGLREQEVCNLKWDWEAEIPELDTSVFVIPSIFSEDGLRGVKNREDRLVVRNAVARSVIEARRGTNPDYVADRKFKPPFSLSATLSLAPQAVNRAVFGDNFALSMIIRTPHRPEAAHSKAV